MEEMLSWYWPAGSGCRKCVCVCWEEERGDVALDVASADSGGAWCWLGGRRAKRCWSGGVGLVAHVGGEGRGRGERRAGAAGVVNILSLPEIYGHLLQGRGLGGGPRVEVPAKGREAAV